MKAASASDYRELAKRRLPRFIFDYVDGGAFDEVTLERNVADLQDVQLRQRILRDVSHVDPSTTLFGQKLAMPIALGPIGMAGLLARRGERQAARAAQAAGIPFCLSTVSACSMTEVTSAVDKPIWFQLYMIRDRGFMRDLLALARDQGCTTLLFTVDVPVAGSRYRDQRSGLSGAFGIKGKSRRLFQALRHPGWVWDVGLNGRPHTLGNLTPVLGPKAGMGDFFGWLRDSFDPSVTWSELDFIRETWKGDLVIKGILDAEDAREAAKLGANGIVVSNHGGRQLDGVPSTARALPEIADAVGDRLTVLADCGVRSGLDVIRMLGLGAKTVLLGRAWAYALAGGGEAGVAHLLRLFEAEMRTAMALTGVTRIDQIGRDMLARWPGLDQNRPQTR
ncbi:FMN-dependent L-lactate dehydrogenase LldD [Sphingomonas sp.]|uniref:FMN-dependent L-lactate dehydrogenase LldD n=1 Tax=Sphingomonas sp. TaxID=28214 RepID=UPI002FCC85A3